MPPAPPTALEADTGLVALRPIDPGDYAPLRRLELSLTLGPRWRHRGATPSPEAFAQTLWSGVLAQYLVDVGRGGQPLGLVTAYGADLQSGTAWLAFARFPGTGHPAAFAIGARRFVDHLFATWPLRKLYAEVLAPNLAAFEGVTDRVFVAEGCHRDHAFLDGSYVDQHLYALWREQWQAATARWSDSVPADRSAIPSLRRFVAVVADALDRPLTDDDADAPLDELALDSLDWVILADVLGRWALDDDAALAALEELVTLRGLHRWLVDQVGPTA